MTYLKTTLATFVAITSAGYAQAQDSGQETGIYGGLGVSAYVTNPVGLSGADLFAAEAKLGYNFNRYFGVEAQGSIGLNTDTIELGPTTIDRKQDYSLAGFAVARLPVTETFKVFARGGIHNTQFGIDTNGELINGVVQDITTRRSTTETGFAVGAGAQFNFDKKNAIRADYTYLDGTNAETLSLGYIRKF